MNSGCNIYLYLYALIVNLLAFSNGVAYSWTSPVLPILGTNDNTINPLPKPTTPFEDSWIASLLSLGAATGPMLAGYCAQRYGRKKTLLTCAIPMIISHLISAFATSVYVFYVARFVLGLGVGGVFSVVPIYIGEISESSNRGLMGCMMPMLLATGMLFCFSVGSYVSVMSLSIMVAVPLVTFVICLRFVPESPYYLISINKDDEAEASLRKLRTRDSGALLKELAEIKRNVEESKKDKMNIRQLFHSRALKKGLVISVGTMFFQQFSGITIVLAYMQNIFNATGSQIPSDISTIIIGSIQLVITIVSSQLVDRLGRRMLLLISAGGVSISLAILGMYFFLQEKHYDLSSVGWLPITSLICYIITYNIGLGPIPWALTGELFATNVKSIAAPITATICVFLAFLLTVFFPSISIVIGMAASFWLFSVASAICIIYIIMCVPETKGKTFQEIFDLLDAPSRTS